MFWRIITVAGLLAASCAWAQEGTGIAPLNAQGDLQRITPLDNKESASDILTTKRNTAAQPATPDVKAAEAPPPPAAKAAEPAGVMPFGVGNTTQPNKYSPNKVPFGRATSLGNDTTPSAPHSTAAIPVVDVDSIEASEPAPPTPVAVEENPAAQDPAEPTELTSPIFSDKDDTRGARKVVVRALNKVTAQSQLFKASPGETVKFGRLEITAIGCRTSSPNSLSDYAGLFEINEQLPGTAAQPGQKKQLFHGWMYASSPSIAALEHPIYDVTMVSCDTVESTPKSDDKPQKKNDKKAKK